MRWYLAATLFFSPACFATVAPCLVYLQGYASQHPLLRNTLGKMAQRWAHNEELISFKTGAILGTHTDVPDARYITRVPRQPQPFELEEIKVMDLLLDEAVQFELSGLYLGRFSRSPLKDQLRGRAPSRAAVVGLFPHAAHQDDVVAWLKARPELAEVPRAVLGQPDSPVLHNLQQETTSIHFGGLAEPWGNLRFQPAFSEYKLVVYGTHLDQSLGPIIGLLALQLFESPHLRTVRVEIPAKLAWLGDDESVDVTRTTSLHALEPRELGMRCHQLAQNLGMILRSRQQEVGHEFHLRLDADRTVTLVFVP